MHEPLILAVVLPCSHVPGYLSPWVAKGTPPFSSLESYAQQGRPHEVSDLEGHLQGLWKNPEELLRAVLLQFLSECENVWCGPCYCQAPSDPFPILENEDAVGDKMPMENAFVYKFRAARDGDHLMGTPFECDLCHFRNLARQDPDLNSPQDIFQLMCIRQAILDSFWARHPSTVTLNRRRTWLDYKDSVDKFDIVQIIPPFGTNTVTDRVGMVIAIITLNASLRPGLYARHLQFQAMRQTPTWYSHQYDSGSNYSTESVYAKDEKKLHVSTCPMAGERFVWFKQGLCLRMGEIRKQNEALTTRILLAVLKEVEQDWLHAPSPSVQEELEEFASALLISFRADLWGEEMILVSKGCS
ncbi:hypothetical protein ACHAWX_000458 [Stephanocyclus meneghinianus]